MQPKNTAVPLKSKDATGLDFSFIETLPVFMDRVSKQPPPRVYVNELACEGTTSMCHGQPRDRKTWAELEINLAAATGTNAFGMERFFVPEPVPVCYLTEEDSELWTFLRFQQLLAGRKLEKPPENFHLSVRTGIDIDDEEWQHRLIAAAKHFGYVTMSVDPLRAFTAYADKGPSDLKPVVRFFRKFMNETGAIRIVHHDTKPLSSGKDDRSPAQRASGGGIFSIADCPLSFQRIDDNKTLVIPSAYKFLENPKPFQFTLESDASSWIRLVGQDVEIKAGQKGLKNLQTLLDAVTQEPGKPISFYVKGRNKQEALDGLKQLNREGQIHFEPKGKAVLCFPGKADIFDQPVWNFNPDATACEQPKAIEEGNGARGKEPH